jgi:CheY-like chemotaxis protein/two-component sensor histidine kinase
MAEARLPEALAEAREGCARIRTIVSDLQLFSRSSEKADTRDVDVRRVLDSAANIVINEIRVRARLTKDYGEVPLIEANATRLGQVFLNLVLNAAQAIGEGQPSTNEIRLVTRVEDGAVIVEVRDSGAGIRPEIRGKIFEPFFTTKALGVGTGLGLSISHRIVSGMGGELTVESEPGAGATFRVRLPVVAERKAAAPSPRPPPVKTTRRRARVLVLDDEAMMGTMLKRVLQGAHDVEAMTNPDDAIARIVGGEHFDVILCDLMMPGRSGIAVHAALAEQAPDQARRMIFLTGGALDADAQAFLELRSGRVVGKPFEVNELLRTIDEALSAPEA